MESEFLLYPIPIILGHGWLNDVLTITPNKGSEIRLTIENLRKNHQLQFLSDNELKSPLHIREGFLTWEKGNKKTVSLDWGELIYLVN
jgi:hypothetical protein|tara:strand:- start:3303 stop:3566 length:264 start_codon:yes stop_codon:yes gene_type:complete